MIRISNGVPQHHDEDAIHRNVETIVTDTTTLKRESTGSILGLHVEGSGVIVGGSPLQLEGEHITKTFIQTYFALYFPDVIGIGTDTSKYLGRMRIVKSSNVLNSRWEIGCLDAAGAYSSRLRIYHDKIDVKNLPIKDIKNHAHSALSGTKKLIEILIGGTPYYFEVYPTKA